MGSICPRRAFTPVRALGGFLGTNKETPTFAFVSLKFPGLGAFWTNKVRDRHEDRFTVETVTRSVVVKKVCPNERPHRSRTRVSIRVSDTQAYPSSLSLLSRAIQETFDSLIHYPLSLPHLLKVCEFWGLSRCHFGPLTIGYWDMAVDQGRKILHVHLLVESVNNSLSLMRHQNTHHQSQHRYHADERKSKREGIKTNYRQYLGVRLTSKVPGAINRFSAEPTLNLKQPFTTSFDGARLSYIE